jgi:hypothetical protein
VCPMTDLSGHDPALPTRGDSPAVAGRSLRGIAKLQQRVLWRARIHLVSCALGAGAAVACAAMLLAMPTDKAVSAAFILTVAVTLLAATFLYPTRVLAAASAITAALLSYFIGRHYAVPPLLQLTAGLLIATSGLLIHNTRRRRRNAAVPTVLAQFSVPSAIAIAGALGLPQLAWMLIAGAATVAGWGWRAEIAVTVAAWRAAVRSRIRYVAGYPNTSRRNVAWMKTEHLERGAAAEKATAVQLAELGPRWHVLHSRALHNTAADADHIVIGPPGVLLLDTKYRSGAFDCIPWVDGDSTGSEWTYNGRPIPEDLVTSALFESERIAWAFRAGEVAGQPVPTILVIHGARMNVPWGEVTFDVTETDPDSGQHSVLDTRTVTLVAAEHVVAYLRQLPARRFTEPTRAERRRARLRGVSETELLVAAQQRYVEDLAAVSEHLFIPAAG